MDVSYGRPDIKGKVLEVVDEVKEAGSQGGSIAVLVCGPAVMADEARRAVQLALKSGMCGIEYVEETFWMVRLKIWIVGNRSPLKKWLAYEM
jgi:ferric-chelate reductase